MANEEKILAMLTEIQREQQAQKNQLNELASVQTNQSAQLAELKATQAEQGKQLAEQGAMIQELRSSVNIIARKQDHDIIPYVRLLDEDYKRAANQPELVNRIDSLEDDMKLMKSASYNHAARLLALEKAK